MVHKNFETNLIKTTTAAKNGRPEILLPIDHLERVSAWGEASASMSYVYRPNTAEGIRKVLKIADQSNRSVGLRGSGNSYGDATLNCENITLDLRRMNRILNWDPANGRVKVEPGVSIADLWTYTIEDGWWPAVVPGTSKPTIGGCAGMNVHGKNAWKVGPIGEHIEEFDLMLPNQEIVTCNRNQNSDLFYSAIGGFGMLGIFTSITLRLKRIHSGQLWVEAIVSHNLAEMITQFEERLAHSDYLVGWIDGLARGQSLGRGQIHKANYLKPDEDPRPHQTLAIDNQHIGDNMFGFVPRSMMWLLMRPFMNNFGVRLVNFGKYQASRISDGSRYRQTHVAFHFLLDYVPNWKKSYGRGGLIQYQCFVPANAALDAFTEILHLCQKRRLPNYLSVLKRHRPDDFLISHGVDGYSLAMDFKIDSRRQTKVLSLTQELDDIVLKAGGRFYLAKDSTLKAETLKASLGQEVVDSFRQLKQEYDPAELLQTNMWRRLF